MKNIVLVLVCLLLSTAAGAHPSVSVVRDSRRNVYYSDLRQVWKIAPDGVKSVAVANVHTHELWLDAQDNLYGEHLWYEGEATDKWGHYVWRLSPDGSMEKVIPPRAGFRDDYGDFSFVRDAAGNQYQAMRDARPLVIRKRTQVGRTTGLGADAGLRDVRWMTAAPDGTVFFTDGPDLVRITPDGKTTRLARNLKVLSWWQFFVGDRHNVMGLWTDQEGNVYVAVYGGRLVKKVSPSGQMTAAARSSPPWSPTGGLVDPTGNLWLLEYSVTNAVRVRRIERNGRETVY